MKWIGPVGMVMAISLWATCSPQSVRAAVDEGIAHPIPWSGYWWPIAKGELLGPLRKYDALTGKRSFQWELENKPPGPHASPWHGYCHGWSAAAVMETEPSVKRRAGGRDGRAPVMLDVADQKGWYSVGHAYDVANNYGDRYGDGEGSEDIHDMAPDMLWRLLKMFLKEHRLPLVVDLDAGKEVWNYPVFAYRIDYQPHDRGGGWYLGQLKLWAADDAVPPEFVGTVPYLQTYTFVFQMRDGAVVLGSGRWTGESVWNHPDFAWYPTIAVPENPEIDYETVKNLIKKSTPQRAPGSTETTRNQPDPIGSKPGKTDSNKPGKTDGNGPELAAGHSGPALGGGKPPVEAWLEQCGIPENGVSENGVSRNGSDDETSVPIPISPMQLVAAIAKKTSQFGLDARLSQFGRVRYLVGQRSAVTGSSERSGYLYVLHVSPTGDLALLHPAPGEENRIEAGATFRVPGAARGDFAVHKPYGNHRIKVLVTQRPLILTGLDRRAPLGAAGDKVQPRSSPGQDDRAMHLSGDHHRSGEKRVADTHGTEPWRGYAFRFLPTQERRIKALLTDYAQSKQLDEGRLDRIEVPRILSSFAQDEITYYVGPSD